MAARAAVLLLLLAGCVARPPQPGVPPPAQALPASPTLTLVAGAPAAQPPGGSPLATPTPLPASATPTPTPTAMPAPPELTPAPASPTSDLSQTTPAATATPAEPVSGPTLPAAEATHAPSPGALAEPALQLLELANQLRSAEGCPALQLEPRLVDAAQRHAQDLAVHVLISHEGSDGATLRERLDRVGFPYQFAGENIAAGYQSAELVMEMWTTGDEYPDGPHRKNILDCRFTAAGVGLAYGSNYGSDHYPYWVLDLASTRQ